MMPSVYLSNSLLGFQFKLSLPAVLQFPAGRPEQMALLRWSNQRFFLVSKPKFIVQWNY
jgi:hypothetical protein